MVMILVIAGGMYSVTIYSPAIYKTQATTQYTIYSFD